MEVRVVTRSELDRQSAEKLCALWLEVWPHKDFQSAAAFAEKLLSGEAINLAHVSGSERFHLLERNGELVAACFTFEREIRFLETNVERTVLALAGVCSSPKQRGEGFGKTIVSSALDRLGNALDCCLFQTGVPDFYLGFGAYFVENQFVNSTNSDAPEANPWWDKCVMAIGAQDKWLAGRVDLLGAAY